MNVKKVQITIQVIMHISIEVQELMFYATQHLTWGYFHTNMKHYKSANLHHV